MTHQQPESEKLRDEITDICFNNGSVSKPMVDKLEALIATQTQAARINSLLDLEQWIKLHNPSTKMILECIEHMCISNMQVPDQPRLNHADRITELQADQEGEV